MDKAAQLAGFFVAHAVWIISKGKGEPLWPFAGFEATDGHRCLVHFEKEEHFGLTVEGAREWLADNPDKALRAVLIFDGIVLLPSGRTDALLIEVREYGACPVSLRMALPYRSGAAPEGFAVYRPKFLEYSASDEDSLDEDYGAINRAFWAGVASHADGAAAWKQIDDAS